LIDVNLKRRADPAHGKGRSPGHRAFGNAHWPSSAPIPALARSPLQHDRLQAHGGLKTAEHENQEKDFHRFACHIDTQEGCRPSGPVATISAQKPGRLLLQIKFRGKSVASLYGC